MNASAIGYYGDRGDAAARRDRRHPATGFLARVCVDWEAEARRAEALGLRVALLRLGIVLAPDGGALSAMLLPFRAGLGGPLGGGRQWMSWVHRDDVVGLLRDAVAKDAYAGPVNATSPNPVTNKDFTRALGRALHRPAVLPVPGFGLRLLVGEMASMLLGGQRVLPGRRRAARATTGASRSFPPRSRPASVRDAHRLRAQQQAVGDRQHDFVHARVLPDVVCEGSQGARVVVLHRRIRHRPRPEDVVEDEQPVRAHARQQLLVVVAIARLVGVDEDEIDLRRRAAGRAAYRARDPSRSSMRSSRPARVQ